MVHSAEVGDVALTHTKAKERLGGSKGEPKNKGKGKKGAKKGKPKDCDSDLFSDSDDDDDDDDIDPEAGVGTAISLPNVLPLPGFLVAGLMEAYTSDAGLLCLTAIDAIRKRARAAGEDPAHSQTAHKAAYVPIGFGTTQPNKQQRPTELRRESGRASP